MHIWIYESAGACGEQWRACVINRRVRFSLTRHVCAISVYLCVCLSLFLSHATYIATHTYNRSGAMPERYTNREIHTYMYLCSSLIMLCICVCLCVCISVYYIAMLTERFMLCIYIEEIYAIYTAVCASLCVYVYLCISMLSLCICILYQITERYIYASERLCCIYIYIIYRYSVLCVYLSVYI